MSVGDWDRATHTDLATLQWILDEIRRYYEHWGRWPTASEIRSLLYGPH